MSFLSADVMSRFGDIDEPFCVALENMWEHFAIELRRSPAKYEPYKQFEPRLMKTRRRDIGWGYCGTVAGNGKRLEQMNSLLQK